MEWKKGIYLFMDLFSGMDQEKSSILSKNNVEHVKSV